MSLVVADAEHNPSPTAINASLGIRTHGGEGDRTRLSQCMLGGEQTSEDRLESAADFARAQVELLVIRSIRAEQLAKTVSGLRLSYAWLNQRDDG
jgi:hypothetical protein